ncbi:MAG: hypothetical protein M1818_003507 [Claussenomyces sp. TS43310]|nr:MAG: hypothetical protein M1818_003507 [Claussenomyces sp. TS43310]
MSAISVAVLLLLNVVLVYGQLGPFINPPERPDNASPDGSTNPVYAVGNPLNITWTPVTGTADLTIWQTRPNGSDIGGLQYLPNSQLLNQSYYYWDAIGVNGKDGQPNFDLAASNIFHFDLYENGGTLASGLSLWFNLTNATVNAQGSVLSTATSSVSLPSSTRSSIITTSSRNSSSQTSSSPTSSRTSSPTQSHVSSGLSSGAKAGIGVGVTLGVLVIIGSILGAFIWNRHKRNAGVNGSQLANPYTDNPATAELRPEYKVEVDGTSRQLTPMESPRVEMDGSPQPGGPVELPSNRYH